MDSRSERRYGRSGHGNRANLWRAATRMTTDPHDNADEPRRARPSVPLVVFDAGGRPINTKEE
jgi:hypothetical protein